MPKYSVFVAYSLSGKAYTEIPNLNCTHKLYDTAEEAIKAIANEIEIEYNNKDYYGLEVKLPKVKHCEGYERLYNGSFECAYKFGPHVHYDIYLVEFFD